MKGTSKQETCRTSLSLQMYKFSVASMEGCEVHLDDLASLVGVELYIILKIQVVVVVLVVTAYITMCRMVIFPLCESRLTICQTVGQVCSGQEELQG